MPGKLILDDGRDVYTSAAEGMAAARAKLPRDIAPEQAPWHGGPVAAPVHDEPFAWSPFVAMCCAWGACVAALAAGLWWLS